MKIAGVYNYDVDLDPKIQHAVSEPYGLERILAIAAERGHEVELFLPLEGTNGSTKSFSEEELAEKVSRFHPDLTCFSEYTCQFPAGERIAAKLKNINPKMITVAGNRYPSYLKDRMPPAFDFFVVNEGEDTFRRLLQEIETTQSFSTVRGLVYRKNNQAIFTGPNQRIRYIDSFPLAVRFPAVLNQVYKGISIPSLSQSPHYALAEYSRGCFGECDFCDNQEVWQRRITFRSPQKVVEELFQLQEKGVDIVYLIDLNFTASPKKARELCVEILHQNLNLSWYCMSNIETADGQEELLHLMKEAGCFKIAWGVEATDDSSLQKMNKRIRGKLLRNEQVSRVLELSLQAGMLNQGYYIIGFPWETAESIMAGAENLPSLPLHQLNVGIFTPIPLSSFFYRGLELDHHLENHDRNHLVYRHPTLDHQTIKALQEQIHRQFYESPVYLERVRRSCQIDSRFRQAFDDYFQYLGNLKKKMEAD